MSKRFTDWKAAHTYAKELANRLDKDCTIRAAKEYGKNGFNVTLACRADAEFYTCETVKPDHRDN